MRPSPRVNSTSRYIHNLHNTLHCEANTVKGVAVQYSALEWSVVQCNKKGSAVQYSEVLYNIVQYSPI